jgi:polyribonucleotide nucleotidyltransferase
VSRLTDRPLRPLFPEGWATETQIVAMVLSADSRERSGCDRGDGRLRRAVYLENSFHESGGVRARGIARRKARREPYLHRAEDQPAEHYRRGHRRAAIVMVEVGRAGSFRRDRCRCARIRARGNSPARRIHQGTRQEGESAEGVGSSPALRRSALQEISAKFGDRLRDALDTAKHPKLESYSLVDGVKKEVLASVPEEDEEKRKLAYRAFERLRENISARICWCGVVVPMGARSTRFARSPAKWACCPACTARRSLRAAKPRRLLRHARHQGRHAAPRSALRGRRFKRFMLHYNFPPFSVAK